MTDIWRTLVRELRLELLVQLFLAVILGGAVGFERELGGKPAGLRTNILICIGSVLYTKLSVTMAGAGYDPTRVAAQIVTGVGFIGAGTILHARGAVVGLTSAATIWVVAAVGMALGTRAYVEALGATLLIMLVLAGLSPLEGFLARFIHRRPNMIRRFLCTAALVATSVTGALAHDAEDHESKVTLVYDQALPNVPGKSIRGVLVEYAPGGSSDAHTHPPSAFI